MATTTAPWGRTPLTTEGLAGLGHPLSLSDFNQDGGGYWRIIRGQKTYYPREWFDDTGTFTGTGTQAGDRAGQDQGFFKQGTKWNWTTGQWENPTNWANVIGLAAAGGVGAGIAAPVIAGALGGGGAAGAGAGADAAGGGGRVASILGPAFGTTGWVAPAVQGITSIINTNKQVGANADATAQQVAASKYAADVEAKTAAESLAYLKQQAAYDATVAESTRAANYDQWAARQQMLGSVGQMLGLPARSIPAYVPLPAYSGGPTSPASGTAGTMAGAPTGTTGGTSATWWNPADPRGSVSALLAGKAPTSQTLLDLAPQFAAAGIQLSPANAEGVTSKIYVPGVGWTRVLDGGVAGGPGGGQGTGWTFVPQGGGGSGAAPAAASVTAPTTAPRGLLDLTANPFPTADPLADVRAYLADPAAATSRLRLPQTYRSPYGGPVGAYL